MNTDVSNTESELIFRLLQSLQYSRSMIEQFSEPHTQMILKPGNCIDTAITNATQYLYSVESK